MKQVLLEKIAAPIAVNLGTALLIFAAIYIFRNEILGFLDPEWPIFYVAEPYSESENGRLLVDLYIVNTDVERKGWLRSELKSRINSRVSGGGGQFSPDILVRWDRSKRRSRGHKIVDIRVDEAFNNGKGKISISKPSEPLKPWTIRIDSVADPRNVMKVTIVTDWTPSGVVTRAQPEILPITIDYPGR